MAATMRVVRRSSMPSLEPGLLPTAEQLEDARFLCKRFAKAGLEEVRLVPLGDPAKRVWLALESMQVTGSFKVRGAMLAVERRMAAFYARGADPNEPFYVVAVSAGNHGVGVAHAAKHLGARAEIVVPRHAPKTKVKKIEEAGAKVIVSSSAGYDDAEKEAIERARERQAAFLSPYDDIDVLLGNGASLAFEITRALGRVPGLVYCPIGGGGLATGLACALRHEVASNGQPQYDPIVLPVQSEASCAFATSLERGEAVTELPPVTTLAEGLEGGISARGFARARSVLEYALVCTEEEIEHALRFAARDLGLLLEGSSAVALVPHLASFKPAMERETDTVIVLTGRNIDSDRLARVC
jgi:threonine dehydratase